MIYHVVEADVQYIGLPYTGALLKAVDPPIASTEFKALEAAIHCADVLQDHSATGWSVVNAFSENVVYCTHKP